MVNHSRFVLATIAKLLAALALLLAACSQEPRVGDVYESRIDAPGDYDHPVICRITEMSDSAISLDCTGGQRSRLANPATFDRQYRRVSD